MTVQLPPDVEASIRQKVESGRFPDAGEVMREAMRLLDERDRLQRLRASLIEAEAELDRGEGVEWTPALMDRLKREADELHRQGAKPDPDVCP